MSPKLPPGDYDLSFYFVIPARSGILQINISTDQSSYTIYEIYGRFPQWQKHNISLKEDKDFRVSNWKAGGLENRVIQQINYIKNAEEAVTILM